VVAVVTRSDEGGRSIEVGVAGAQGPSNVRSTKMAREVEGRQRNNSVHDQGVQLLYCGRGCMVDILHHQPFGDDEHCSTVGLCDGRRCRPRAVRVTRVR
jgi:hypothetical protein